MIDLLLSVLRLLYLCRDYQLALEFDDFFTGNCITAILGYLQKYIY